MAKIPYDVTDAKIRLVPDNQYHQMLRTILDKCTNRFWSSLFIVDLCPWRDKPLLVDSVLMAIRDAVWRGVDARLLIGGSRTNFDIAQLSDAGRARALSLKIPCRWLTSHKTRGSHVKMVIADRLILTGSHNWSNGAMTDQIQDSLLVESAALASYLSSRFEEQWNRTGESDV